jgi:hypothetical protein
VAIRSRDQRRRRPRDDYVTARHGAITFSANRWYGIEPARVRLRGDAITPTDGGARVLAVETDHPALPSRTIAPGESDHAWTGGASPHQPHRDVANSIVSGRSHQMAKAIARCARSALCGSRDGSGVECRAKPKADLLSARPGPGASRERPGCRRTDAAQHLGMSGRSRQGLEVPLGA